MPSIDFPNSPSVDDVFTVGNTSYVWNGTVWVGSSLTTVSWDAVSEKPSTFSPSTHTHAISDTTGLQTALNGKAATSHAHAIADVTGLQTALDAKAAKLQTIQQLTANVTMPAGSNGKLFYSSSSSTITVQILYANIEAGERIDFLQTGSGKITISPFMGLQMVSDGNKLSTNGAGTALSLMCYLSDGTYKWLAVVGNLS